MKMSIAQKGDLVLAAILCLWIVDSAGLFIGLLACQHVAALECAPGTYAVLVAALVAVLVGGAVAVCGHARWTSGQPCECLAPVDDETARDYLEDAEKTDVRCADVRCCGWWRALPPPAPAPRGKGKEDAEGVVVVAESAASSGGSEVSCFAAPPSAEEDDVVDEATARYYTDGGD